MYKTEKILKVSERGRVELVSDGNGKLLIRRTVNASDISGKAIEIIKENPHELIPEIFSVELEGDNIVITEEYTEGEPLKCASLSDRQVIRAAEEICRALSHIHSLGVIHRDIKPSNILLAADGHIRLIDFETARVINADSDKDTVYLGTEGYAPPEQYGYSQTDIRSDIYALGKTFEQIMGSMAYQKKYRAVIDKCTEFDPKNRYSNADEVRRALKGQGSAPYIFAAAIILIFAAIAAIPRGGGDASIPDEADIPGDTPKIIYGGDILEKFPTSLMKIDTEKALPVTDFPEPALVKAADGTDMKYIAIDGKALKENKYAAMALDFDNDGVTEIFQISACLEEGRPESERKLTAGISYRSREDSVMADAADDYYAYAVFPERDIYEIADAYDEDGVHFTYYAIPDDFQAQVTLADFNGDGRDECIISLGTIHSYLIEGEIITENGWLYNAVFFTDTNKKLLLTDLDGETLYFRSRAPMYIDGSGRAKTISGDGYINEYNIFKGVLDYSIPLRNTVYDDKSDYAEIDPEIVRQMEAHGLTPP